MELYFNLFNFIGQDTTSSVVYLYCYLFIFLNSAHLGTQDETSITHNNSSSSHESIESATPEDDRKYFLKPDEKYMKFEIHYSLNDIWDIINRPEFSGVAVVKKIKDMWSSTKPRKIVFKKPRIKRKNATTTTMGPDGAVEVETTTHYETTTRVRLPGRQNPFVLIEGTLTTTRRNLTRGLMKHTTFVYVRNFRQYPFKYNDKFDSFSLLRLRRAFVSLQFYITGRDLEQILEDRPVIMSGFWMRQAAEFIARKYTKLSKLPPVGSSCYKWPADLTRPDIVYFLHTQRNDSRITKETLERLERIIEIYRRMDPPVIFLDESYNILSDKKVAQLRTSMLENLSKTYPYAHEFVKYKTSIGKNKTRRAKKKRKKHVKHGNATLIEETTTIKK